MNTKAAVEFLQVHRKGGPWVLTAIAPDRKNLVTATFDGEHIDDLCEWLKTSNEKLCRGIYFSVNPTIGKMEKKAKESDISAVEWLHVDVDPAPGKKLEDERDRILTLLQSDAHKLPAPTTIVFSGGGYQAFWKLQSPIVIDGNQKKANEAKRYNQQIETMLRADACHNIDRIMRLPGSINHPSEKKRKRGQLPVMAEVVDYSSARVYDISEFTAAPLVQDCTMQDSQVQVQISGNVTRVDQGDLDTILPKGVSDRCKVAIVQGIDVDQPLTGDNSRSEWLFYVVCNLVRAGTEDDTVYAIITDPDYAISSSVLDKGSNSAIERYAVRQIQRAKEHAIEPMLEQMNRDYSVVESIGGKFRICRELWDPSTERMDIDFLLKDGFTATYANKYVEVVSNTPKGSVVKQIPVGKWWLEHPNRRTYRRVVFYPGREFPDTLNLWRGFAFEAIPGDCSLFLDHVREVLCKGVTEYSDYLIGWMANAIQNPHMPGQVAVVMRGEQGTGKGMFATIFGKLFGIHYKTVSQTAHLVGNFNSMLQDAALVLADECFVTGSKGDEGVLKHLITDPTVRIEMKGVDTTEARNCISLIMATNSDWAVSADLDDRRFFVVEVDNSHKEDVNYFAALLEQMDAGGYAALLYYLLSYDLSNFSLRNCPKTDELRAQQEHSLTGMQAFWLTRLEEGSLMPGHSGWQGEVLKNQFVDCYQNDYGIRKSAKIALGKFLSRVTGSLDMSQQKRGMSANWEKSNGKTQMESDPWVWVFPSLEECRNVWDTKYGKRRWPVVTAGESSTEPF